MTYSYGYNREEFSSTDEYYKDQAEKRLCMHGLIALVAVELIMSFSVLGYMNIPPVSVSFVYIPVVIAACFMRTREAVIVGIVAGLAGMFRLSAHFVQPLDQLFSPFFSGNPVGSIFICVVTRALLGLVIALLYKAARKSAYPFVGMILVTLSAKIVHVCILFAAMRIFFPETATKITDTFYNFFNIANALGIFMLTVIILLCFCILRTKCWQIFKHNILSAYELRLSVRHHSTFYWLMILTVLLLSMAVSLYLLDRLDNMYYYVGLDLPAFMLIDQTVLYVQFVTGITAITALFGVALRLYYLNQSYINHELMTDDVTRLLNRKNFFKRCEEKLGRAGLQHEDVGFMIIDADYFKKINDTYGHMEGDRVLRKMADALKSCFSDIGVLGRLGGDEFAVFLYKETDQESIKHRLNLMYEKVRSIKCGDINVSCSTGAVIKKMSVSSDILYKNADEMLYIAKERGRNQYVLSVNQLCFS